ncbi:MAG TPA: glycosyltransferase family A protein [Gaiellaceae bacterium]|nr:glycosyltransferase family A protein [Gaiellaceae bacterium]
MPRLTAIVPATNAPATLERCLAAIAAAADPPEEIVVVEEPHLAGPALARNAGALRANGDILVFVDADVEVHEDAFTLIRAAFERDPELSAVFGSYDDRPGAPGLVSSFRNLLHHHVHQSSAGPAGTFWAGLGAVRSEAFHAVGGFDDDRFARPSVEDIDLGMRLCARGGRVLLDPRIQGKHLKRWGLVNMVRTDLLSRGIPWMGLLLRHRSSSSALNLGWRHRLSAGSCVAGVGAVAAQRFLLTLVVLVLFVALNGGFYRLLLRRGGPLTAVVGVPLHAVHHLTAVVAVPAGLVAFVVHARAEARATERIPVQSS